ncbi:MAG: CoA-binding protein [archaeon]|nr:MAG: CoA-binding protein [archaeon]
MTLDKFFNPKSVCIIGASRNPRKIGHVILRNFTETFGGKIYPVNPKAKKILGLKCYHSLEKIKGKVDLAVIALPAQIVPYILEECGEKGVKNCIIVSSGFRETGNTKLEKKLERVIEKYDIRMIGPNGLGVYDPYSGIDTIFNPKHKLGRPEKGDIGFISQSGAVMCISLDWMSMRGYRISKAISYGNATDVDVPELMEYLDRDKKTKVICLYLEGLKNGRNFFNTAKKTKKPVIVLKGGKTQSGRKSAKTHTGALAGKAGIYSGAFRQTGIIEAEDLEKMFDLARALSNQPLPKGNRLRIITDAGGFGVLTSDWADKFGLRITKVSKKSKKKLKKLVPEHATLGNIIDLTGDATSEMYEACYRDAVRDKSVDMIALILLFQPPLIKEDLVNKVLKLSGKKTTAILSAGGDYTENLKKKLEEGGMPCFSSPKRCIEVLHALYSYSKK